MLLGGCSLRSYAINLVGDALASGDSVYESDEVETLQPDQQRLVWLTYDSFARNGATLEGEVKRRYAEINQRLAELHTRFANNILADEESYVTYISEAQLGGLPDSFVHAALAAAGAPRREGEGAPVDGRGRERRLLDGGRTWDRASPASARGIP